MTKLRVTKASGAVENFDPSKLFNSLVRSGAEEEEAQDIIEKIIAEIEPFTSTKKIFRLAHKYLRQFNRISGLKYSLKRGLLRLGPSGYPFEKYFGELLKQYGYRVRVGLIQEGKCVKHEIDVLAENERELLLVECKYRNSAESAPDVKIAMYVHARFLDLRSAMRDSFPEKKFSGWLVTNTRFTADAIQYAECVGLTIKSWKYPSVHSVEEMIEDKKLYPVTIMSGLSSAQVRKLMERNIILMRDFARLETREIKRLLSVPENRAFTLREEADKLCFCNDI